MGARQVESGFWAVKACPVVKVMLDREELLARLANFRQMWVNGLSPSDDMSKVKIDLNLFFDDLVNILGLVDNGDLS